jgi:hypothetical protein
MRNQIKSKKKTKKESRPKMTKAIINILKVQINRKYLKESVNLKKKSKKLQNQKKQSKKSQIKKKQSKKLQIQKKKSKKLQKHKSKVIINKNQNKNLKICKVITSNLNQSIIWMKNKKMS